MTTNKNKDATLTKQIQLLTLNINGLHKDDKRMTAFEYIINKNIDIALLQETQSTRKITPKWEKAWKGKSLWHSGPIPKSSGVAKLFNQKLYLEIINFEHDSDGRLLKCTIEIEKQIFQIVNIYAPTYMFQLIQKTKNNFIKRFQNS